MPRIRGSPADFSFNGSEILESGTSRPSPVAVIVPPAAVVAVTLQKYTRFLASLLRITPPPATSFAPSKSVLSQIWWTKLGWSARPSQVPSLHL